MSKVELEKRILELETTISKATYMVENFIDLYNLDSQSKNTIDEALLFSYNKTGMFMSMSIIHDYLFNAKNNVKKLEEGVCL